MENADVKKNGWSAEELGEQSTYEDTTEITKRLRRGDETMGDPDARDVAGAIPEEDTPRGAKPATDRTNQPSKIKRGRRLRATMKMRLLIAYDGSEGADAALDDRQQAGLGNNVEALILSVAELWLPPPPPSSGADESFPLYTPPGLGTK